MGPCAMRVYETSLETSLLSHVEARGAVWTRGAVRARVQYGAVRSACPRDLPRPPPRFSMGPYAVRVRAAPPARPRETLETRECVSARPRQCVSARPARPPCPRDPRDPRVRETPARPSCRETLARPSYAVRVRADPCASARPSSASARLARPSLTQCVSARPSLSARPSRPFVLATAGRDGMIWLWDLVRGEDVVRLPATRASSGRWPSAPTARCWRPGSGDATVGLWDTGAVEGSLPGPAQAETLRPEAERLVEQLWRKENDLAAVAKALGPTGR